jgi:hypothetical protein
MEKIKAAARKSGMFIVVDSETYFALYRQRPVWAEPRHRRRDPGPAIISCGRSSMKACAKISLRPRCAASCRTQNPVRQAAQPLTRDDHAADFAAPLRRERPLGYLGDIANREQTAIHCSPTERHARFSH